MARDDKLMRVKRNISSEILGLRHHITYLGEKIHLTDIYLDRYLPTSVLSSIWEAVNNSIDDYEVRKEFCLRMKEKFD
jgi:hypothetical protein